MVKGYVGSRDPDHWNEKNKRVRLNNPHVNLVTRNLSKILQRSA